MAEGVINGSNLSLFAIVLGVLLVDVFSIRGSFCSTPLPTSSNPWNKFNQSFVVTPPVLGGSTSTTPWPELGAKRRPNKQQTVNFQQPVPNSQQQNTNSQQQSLNSQQQTFNSQQKTQFANPNIQLSYNTNPSQNQNLPQRLNSPNSAGGPHSGLALSYGPGQATLVQKPKAQMSNQNFNQAVTVNQSKQPSTIGPTNPSTTSTVKPDNEDEELRQFFEQLIKKDSGSLVQRVTVNYQGKTTSRSLVDEAPLPLLDIRPDVYQVPSVSKLLALHNNYILETNVNEHITPQERIEENDLLDTIIGTPVMQAARNFLIQKGIVSKDPKDFRDKLKEIWFTMYSRGGGKIGSSGFEHVFLTEIKQKEISGLHNWLYFKDAEAKGLANYLGYMRKVDLGTKGVILKHHFTFNGLDKPVGSMFIGTSPELEIALYSTCFLLKPDKVCPMRFDGKNFIIRTYTFRYRGKNMIGSAFPEI